MAFSTHHFISLLSVALLLLGACAREPVEQRFDIRDVGLRPSGNGISVRLAIDARLSHAAQRALSRGVTLTFLVNSEVRRLDSRDLVTAARDHWTLRYLPLSEQYQLNGPGPEDSETYPRLRHVMRELGQLQYRVETDALAPGQYEFRVRARLDRSALPAPMQLPAMLFPYLRHDSGWTEWPLKTSG